MNKKTLIEVDARIAQIQNDLASGRAGQISQVELLELLRDRQTLIAPAPNSGPVPPPALQPARERKR